MANDKKWTYLAELAHMILDWDKVLEEIHNAIIRNNVTTDVNDSESDVEGEE